LTDFQRVLRKKHAAGDGLLSGNSGSPPSALFIDFVHWINGLQNTPGWLTQPSGRPFTVSSPPGWEARGSKATK
jgi:hypothetical protein